MEALKFLAEILLLTVSFCVYAVLMTIIAVFDTIDSIHKKIIKKYRR